MKRSALSPAIAGVVLLAGVAAGTPASAVEPKSGTDITGQTVYLSPNARLRYGTSFLSRVYSFTSASLQLKGTGLCTPLNCPVSHNGVALFARRIHVDTTKPTGTIITERPLRLGDEGEDVKTMQAILIKKGYVEVKADGSFGKETREAVRDFQKKSGILVDGEIGAETRNKLQI